MIKRAVKRLFRRIGYEVHRFRPPVSRLAHVGQILEATRIDLVLDVGANEGQFAQELIELGYRRELISFEQLADPCLHLIANAGSFLQWRVAERMALGNADGEIVINVAANSASSSALPMLDEHVRAAPESAIAGMETVPLRRLDSIADQYVPRDRQILLKIDTQGYEGRVLDGASGIMDRITAVQLELSLVPLYAGQSLFHELVEKMRVMGFVLWAVWPVFIDPVSGRTLQLDGIFVREHESK